MMRPRLGFVVLCLTCVALAGCEGFIQTIEPTPTLITQRESVRQRPMVPVERGEVVEAIRTTARVEAERREDLFFKTSGRIQFINVKQGDTVSAGEVLAQLETGQLEGEIANAQEAVNTAQLKLDAAQAEAVSARAGIDATAARAELDLEQVQLEFDRLLVRASEEQLAELGLPRPELDVVMDFDPDVNDAEIALLHARESTSDARRRLAELEFADIFAESEAIAQARAELRQLRAQVASASDAIQREVAQAQVDRFLEGRTEAEALQVRAARLVTAGREAIFAAQAALAAAEADLRAKEARYQELTGVPSAAQLRLGQSRLVVAQVALEQALEDLERVDRGESTADFDLQILNADLERARIGLAALQEQSGQGQIVAPYDGEVTYTKGRAGTQANAFEEFVGIADPAKLVVEVRVADTDRQKLSVGQPVEVALDAFPGVKFAGSLASTPRSVVTATGQTVTIPTANIEVDWGREGIRIGMLARVNITLQTQTDVLRIPITAVKTLNERTFVETVVNEQRRSLPIVTGIKSDTEIEVISGLEEGQMIFASP